MPSSKEVAAAYGRERRAALKKYNLCTRCGVSGPVPGKTTCRDCSEYIKSYVRNRRAALKAARKCVECLQPLPKCRKGTRCSPCQEKVNRNNRRSRVLREIKWIDPVD